MDQIAGGLSAIWKMLEHVQTKTLEADNADPDINDELETIRYGLAEIAGPRSVATDFALTSHRGYLSKVHEINETQMPRRRERVCLQNGLYLDLPWLMRNHFINLTALSWGRTINWTRPNVGVIASAYVCADVIGETEGCLKVSMASISQEIKLLAQPRNFGGRQWYFICPVTGRLASVIWKPPGASLFASRHAWPSQVAYLSQFRGWIDRAHSGKAKIRARLSNNCEPESCIPPPRPKGMRLRTYNRLVSRFADYQAKLDSGLADLGSKWSSRYARDFE